MSTLHRMIGMANIFSLLLIFFLAQMAANLLGGFVIISVLILLFLICTVWGIRNAKRYWGGPSKLEVTDHILLSAGVFNGFLLVTAIAMFIYYGEN